MIICCDCKTEMMCQKNGVGFNFGNGHVYEGDRYECPKCGKQSAKTNENAAFDPEYKLFREYVDMDGADRNFEYRIIILG